MTVRSLVDVSEGCSSGMMQKVTRLEEVKGRIMRFVVETVTKDRAFEEKSCIVGGCLCKFIDGLKTEGTQVCLNDDGKKCHFKGHVSKEMQRNWPWQRN